MSVPMSSQAALDSSAAVSSSCADSSDSSEDCLSHHLCSDTSNTAISTSHEVIGCSVVEHDVKSVCSASAIASVCTYLERGFTQVQPPKLPFAVQRMQPYFHAHTLKAHAERYHTELALHLNQTIAKLASIRGCEEFASKPLHELMTALPTIKHRERRRNQSCQSPQSLWWGLVESHDVLAHHSSPRRRWRRRQARPTSYASYQ